MIWVDGMDLEAKEEEVLFSFHPLACLVCGCDGGWAQGYSGKFDWRGHSQWTPTQVPLAAETSMIAAVVGGQVRKDMDLRRRNKNTHDYLSPLLHIPPLLWIHIPQNWLLRLDLVVPLARLRYWKAQLQADEVDYPPCAQAHSHEGHEQREESHQEAERDRVTAIEGVWVDVRRSVGGGLLRECGTRGKGLQCHGLAKDSWGRREREGWKSILA